MLILGVLIVPYLEHHVHLLVVENGAGVRLKQLHQGHEVAGVGGSKMADRLLGVPAEEFGVRKQARAEDFLLEKYIFTL